MEPKTVKQINNLAEKCYLTMFDIVGNHTDKAIYRETFINGLFNNNLTGIGIKQDLQTEVFALCDSYEKKELFIAFLFVDRTGRTHLEIFTDAGLSIDQIKNSDAGNI